MQQVLAHTRIHTSRRPPGAIFPSLIICGELSAFHPVMRCLRPSANWSYLEINNVTRTVYIALRRSHSPFPLSPLCPPRPTPRPARMRMRSRYHAFLVRALLVQRKSMRNAPDPQGASTCPPHRSNFSVNAHDSCHPYYGLLLHATSQSPARVSPSSSPSPSWPERSHTGPPVRAFSPCAPTSGTRPLTHAHCVPQLKGAEKDKRHLEERTSILLIVSDLLILICEV